MKIFNVICACLAGMLAFPLAAQGLKAFGPVKVVSSEDRGKLVVHDLAWESGNDWWDQSSAWLLVPKGRIKAVLVYLHMYGHGVDRDQFLDEAVELAEQGFASLLPQGEVPWVNRWQGDAGDLELLACQLQDLQTALDFLAAQGFADSRHVALVAHDYGAMNAAVLLARGYKAGAAVLLAPSPFWGDWIGYFNSQAGTDYNRLFGKDQPLTAVSDLGSLPVLLQFGDRDRFVDDRMVDLFRKQAKSAQIQVLKGSDHDSVASDGLAGRMAFIKKALGLE